MRSNSRNRARERGIALPFVLVVTMSLVVLVGDLGLRSQVTFDRSRRSLRMAEARSLLRKIEASLGGLGADEMEKLAKDDVEFDVDDFQVKLSVDHSESKLNIGRLDDLTLGRPIQDLFAALLKRERLEQRAHASALDWVDADDVPRPGGAERTDYLGEDVVPRDAPFETVDELTFVRGFQDPSSFDRIRPYLTAYGSGRLYLPAASDEMMDLLEDVFGLAARNSLERMRRYPGTAFQVPAGVLTPAASQSLQSIVTDAPTAWEVRLILTGTNFYMRADYVYTSGDGGKSLIRLG